MIGGGYSVLPQRIEFWQGQSDRLHDRFLYERSDKKSDDQQLSEWQILRLSP